LAKRTRRMHVAMGAATILVLLGVAAPAEAAEYPSWSDVESARSSEAGKQAQVTELTALIAGLTTEVDAARAEAARSATEYEAAQNAFDIATFRATNLRDQADEAAAAAGVSGVQAGRLAAMLARSGNSNLSMSLIVDAPNASDLLDQLGSMSKLTERMSLVYESAAADRNSARSLTDQAEVAQQTLGALSKKAETALAEAMAASIQVETALADQQEIAGTLQAQLAVLSEDRAATEADYAAGEDIRRAAEAAAAKARAAQAAVAAASAAATTASNTVSGQGWALPVSGWISSWFGPRPNKPVAGVGAFHHGTDIAAGCGRNVYAASAGTVVYAGWLGSYGNWVLIDHGDGTQTGYAHNSSLLVSPGQQVSAGATIALVGTTGASSGCHVHFETRVNGARVDPQAFMSARGVTLG